MKLSVIIVSYNVSAFLENTLRSVQASVRGLDAEIFVVDNDSADDSAYMVSRKFPEVNLIVNTENAGFSKANNQAIRQARGEYILLLNPDTLVSEETCAKCIAFMDTHPDAGAMGVKLVDGSGSYLPESKRGFPTPFAAFCKMTGLSGLFPGSSLFNRYYLGHLDPTQTHEVDVLCGAFMFIRASVFETTGLLDEDYFMYGEDIDLSYRICQAGFRNYYYPETAIIHYKGESTKKASLKYVNTFYQAMFIFLQKHYSSRTSSPFMGLIRAGILARAFLGSSKRLLLKTAPVLVDLVLIIAVLSLLKQFWAGFYFDDPGHFDRTFDRVNIPLYATIWLFFLFLAGSYDTYSSRKRAFTGILTGTLVVLLVYAILPLSLRSSRAVILLGALLILIALLAVRFLAQVISRQTSGAVSKGLKRTLIVARREDAERIMDLINRSNARIELVGCVSPGAENPDPGFYLNTIQKLQELVLLYHVEELIFSTRDVPFSRISQIMTETGPSVEYKIASDQNYSIVGSRSKDTSGELYTMDIQFRINDPVQRRFKRIFDILVTLVVLLGSPILIFSVRRKWSFLNNCFRILMNRRTWIGYHEKDPFLDDLPVLKPGILPPGQEDDLAAGNTQSRHMRNVLYAREYSIWKDFEIFTGAIPELGGKG